MGERSGGRTTYVVALVVVAVIGAVAGVALALSSGDDPAPSAGPHGPESSGSSSSATTPTTPTSPTSPTPPEASPTALETVFPSMAGQSCGQDTQAEATGVAGRLRRWRCTADYHGDTATIFYSEWTTSSAAVTYADSWTGGTYARTGGSDRAGAGFLRWAGTNEGDYKLTWTYVDAPFSVTVVLPRSERPTTDEVLASGLITLRPPQDLAGLS